MGRYKERGNDFKNIKYFEEKSGFTTLELEKQLK